MHPLAIATLWLGLLGGGSGLWILWIAASLSPAFAFGVLTGSLGVIGMSVSLFGAGLARLPEWELAGRRLIDSNRSGALLVCAGATAGLIGSATFGFFAVLTLASFTSFTLILLFGVLMLQRGKEGRLLAAATLYFALVGVAADLFFLPGVAYYGGTATWDLATLPIATLVAGTGAIIRLYSGESDDNSSEPSADEGRNWLAATFMCGGAVLGLIVFSPIISRLPFALFGEIAFAFVLILGLVLFPKQPVGRVLAAGAAWFAVFGGAVSVAFLLFGLIVTSGTLSGTLLLVGVLGIVAMAISLVGARLKLRIPV
jgi:uncharacterized membrane protein YhaH (DUF805 family)